MVVRVRECGMVCGMEHETRASHGGEGLQCKEEKKKCIER
jgi:hypothetical protein